MPKLSFLRKRESTKRTGCWINSGMTNFDMFTCWSNNCQVGEKTGRGLSPYFHIRKNRGPVPLFVPLFYYYTGGERGIRTPGTPLGAYTRFPVVLLQPLG